MNEFLGWAHTLATTFRFARPWWLLLLAVLPWFWWIARPAKPALPFRSGAFSAGPGTSMGRARSSTRNPGSTLGRLAMRSVIVVTTVLGIAGLTVAAPGSRGRNRLPHRHLRKHSCRRTGRRDGICHRRP